jgi:hypothetical protein
MRYVFRHELDPSLAFDKSLAAQGESKSED